MASTLRTRLQLSNSFDEACSYCRIEYGRHSGVLNHKSIPDTMNGEDELWTVGLSFDFLTEPCNVHVDGSGEWHRFISPHYCQKFVSRDCSTGMLDKVSKQLEFPCRQVNWLAIAKYLLRCQIHSNVAELNDLRSRHAELRLSVPRFVSDYLQRRGNPEIRENSFNIARPHVLHQNFRKNVTEVRRDGAVAAFEKMIGIQTRPAPVNFSAFHRPTQHKHTARMAVICATGAVLTDSTTEFRHGKNHDVAHPIAEIAIQCGQAIAEFFHTIRKLASCGAL